MPACREATEDGSCADGGIREAFVGGGWGGKTVPGYCGKSGARPWLNQKAPVAKGTEKGCAPGKVLCPAGLPGNAGASCLPGVRVAKVRPSGCGSRERHAQGRGLTSLPFFKYDRGAGLKSSGRHPLQGGPLSALRWLSMHGARPFPSAAARSCLRGREDRLRSCSGLSGRSGT